MTTIRAKINEILMVLLNIVCNKFSQKDILIEAS